MSEHLRFWLPLAAVALFSIASVHAAEGRPDVVIAVNELPRGLEPGEDHGNVDVRATYSIFDTLIRRDFSVAGGGNASLKPLLAESWKRVSPTILEVRLRKGVRFHNGDELTADDVVFTFSPERLSGARTRSSSAGASSSSHLKQVEKLDPYTVRFVTERPTSCWSSASRRIPRRVVNRRQWMAFQKADDKPWMQRALREVRWNPARDRPAQVPRLEERPVRRVHRERSYFLGRPNFRSVTMREVPELSTRIAGLVSGEFDIIVDITPDQLPVLARYKDVDVHSVVLENSHIILFNTTAPALKDKRLRQALSYAIDRKKLNDALWQGRTIPNGYQLRSFGAMYKPRPGYTFDLERARRLVKESGYGGQPIALRLIPNYYLNGMESAQVLLEMWKAAGINVRLELLENFKQVRARGWKCTSGPTPIAFPIPAARSTSCTARTRRSAALEVLARPGGVQQARRRRRDHDRPQGALQGLPGDARHLRRRDADDRPLQPALQLRLQEARRLEAVSAVLHGLSSRRFSREVMPDAVSDALLDVRNLHVVFEAEQGAVHAVRGVSFHVGRGETLGIVGESGCGKSVSCWLCWGSLPGNSRVVGEVSFEGRAPPRSPARALDTHPRARDRHDLPGPRGLAQPGAHDRPPDRESLRLHRGMDARGAGRDLAAPRARRNSGGAPAVGAYPHQLSGGMNQRAMIAMALACRPKLLIADEPTTALDVTIQAQIIELLKDLQAEFGMSLILITHDLGVVAELADRVAVMYAGRIVEEADVRTLFRAPSHPYTVGLLASMPRIDRTAETLHPSKAPSRRRAMCFPAVRSHRAAASPMRFAKAHRRRWMRSAHAGPPVFIRRPWREHGTHPGG